jgi:NTP pyrophosphatase (non-canonical NTP hydrolase)
MTIQDLTKQYQVISKFLNDRWPLKDHDQRTFARTMKIVEELGELSDEILTGMNLQRQSKIAKFSRKNLEDEFADVLASLVLLSIELDIDIEKVIKRKIELTRERFEIDE